jgi:2-keto-3-deoxy-L-rhamnonate aldolase RhmA
MSASMGHPGQIDHPDVQNGIARVAEVAQKANIPLGISVPDKKKARELMDKGYRFFVIGADVEFLFKGVRRFFESEEK